MEKEIYKDITGYEGLYQVSDRGNVVRVKSGRVLKPGVHTGGYHQVGLCKENVKKNYSVHRLVALTFISNTENKKEVNHIDGVKSNNSIENLEWSTREENIRHSIDVLGNMVGEKHPMYGKLGAGNPSSKTVVQLSKEGVQIKIFGSSHEAHRETGVDHSSISKVCHGKRNYSGGFVWRYA